MNSKQTLYKKLVSVFMVVAVFSAVIILSSSFSVFAASVNTVDRMEFNKTVAYMVTAVIAFALLIGYCALTKKKEIAFILLFTAVFIVNLGYSFGSASTTLEEALLANKISYLGASFLPLFMLIIIMDECRFKRNKILMSVLLCITGGIFFLTMTPGYTTWYYESVELVFVSGGAKLIKTYGPLHKLYLVYLVLYFVLMIASILWAMISKKHSSPQIPLSLLALVFGNILIWFIEQRVNIVYEFLSISYLVTELFLLSLYNVLHRNEEYIQCQNCSVAAQNTQKENIRTADDDFDSEFVPDMQNIINAWPAVAQLTARETEVFKMLILNKKRKDIAEEMCVSENTVKKHTTNIFTKLGVSSRADIMNMLLKIK